MWKRTRSRSSRQNAQGRWHQSGGTIRATKKMKVIENNNYGQYLKAGLIDFFSQTTNYVYFGLIVLALGLIWYRDGLWTTFKVFTVMTNGFTVTFLLTEGLMTLVYREFKRNRYITYILIIGALTTINTLCFDNKALYWSFAAGLLFMVPVMIALVFTKIKFWWR